MSLEKSAMHRLPGACLFDDEPPRFQIADLRLRSETHESISANNLPCYSLCKLVMKTL